jgi:RNA polymerase sigma-70 factor, ECF subfamily
MTDDLRELPEDELVRRARHEPGSGPARAAAAELLGRHRQRVYLWCRRFARDHERALDLSQDVLLAAYRALPGFEGRAPFAAWLYTIARHRCIRAMRPVSLTQDEGADLEALVDPAPGPAEQVEDRDEQARVMTLVRDHLDAREQEALWLRCVERMPVDEITRVLGVTGASGARGLLQTARRKLRAALGADEPGGLR